MILVVCATNAELRFARSRAEVEVLAAGVGPVEAAVATARALARAPYAYAINAGIAGAFRGAAAVGEAVVVTSESLAELGLESGAPLALPDDAALVDRVAADDAAVRAAGLALPHVHGLTVCTITTTDERAERLRDRYNAAVESMEGFSVLRAAALAGVAAFEIRGISNVVGDRARSGWDFDAGARAAARALDTALDRLLR